MSVREGFLRIEALYWRRWWLIVVAPAVMFAYQILQRPPAFGMNPEIWLAAKAISLGTASMLALAIVTWVVLGFIAPPAEWELQLEATRKLAPANDEREPPTA